MVSNMNTLRLIKQVWYYLMTHHVINLLLSIILIDAYHLKKISYNYTIMKT